MIFNYVLDIIKERKKRIEDGLFNCIPLSFPRFRRIFPGIEPSKYIIVTANQKVGKSKFVDFVFVYEAIFFMINNPNSNIKIKVLYFTLEVDILTKYLEFISHLLLRLDNIIISASDLRSVDKPVDSKIVELIESDKYKPYIELYEKVVIYISDQRNPTGINKYCRNYALEHGKLNYKNIEVVDKETGIIKNMRIIDKTNPYTPDDPEEIRYIIVDNAANLMAEQGLNKAGTIDKLSKYGITLRDQLNYVFVLVQHQAQAQEGIENFKLNRLKPTSDGLADCKTTSRDANIVIGLYSPFKHSIKEYEGYDITKFRNSIRFMEILEDREYGGNGQICPLFFNGASSYFAELPRKDDIEGLNRVYRYLNSLKTNTSLIFMSIAVNNKINIIKKIFNMLKYKFKVWLRF